MLLDGRRESKYRRLRVPLVRCSACKRSARVLPAELLPYKTFGLPVIEKAVGLYVSSEPSGPGLREAVGRLGRCAPVFSTLHRWLAGIGERVLDRVARRRDDPKGGSSILPTSASLVSESSQRLDPSLTRAWRESFPIPPWKYQSERRREQLSACARLLAAARRLFPDSPSPLLAWEVWLSARFGVTAWTFSTGPGGTAMQLPPPPRPRIASPRSTKTRKGDARHAPRPPPRGLLPL